MMIRIVSRVLTTITVIAAFSWTEGQEIHANTASTLYTIKTNGDFSTMSPSISPNAKQKDRWLMYVSAGPTVFIFIICVIAISVKNCSGEDKPEEDTRILSPTATSVPTSPMALLKPNKPKIINEVYDKMLEQFKDDKNKNKALTGRKCSQIKIEGVESGSPKSLARKHIIIGKRKEEETIHEDPEDEEDPIKSLVRTRSNKLKKCRRSLSVRCKIGHKNTATFIGRPVVHRMQKNESINSEDTIEIKDTVRGILRTSIDDLTEADRRTFCDEIDEVLLPEDLEEAFKDFEYWAESYA